MDIFGAYTYQWWQIGLLKASLLSLGILIGAYYSGFFRKRAAAIILWFVFAIPAAYLIIQTLGQLR